MVGTVHDGCPGDWSSSVSRILFPTSLVFGGMSLFNEMASALAPRSSLSQASYWYTCCSHCLCLHGFRDFFATMDGSSVFIPLVKTSASRVESSLASEGLHGLGTR